MEFIREYQLDLIFRIIVACVCGIAIGFERKNRAKEAGVRTHCIVACASALMMIVSKYGFYDLIINAVKEGADVRLDPSRLAQGIVTGVGFLGAGMIYIQRGSIRGLTTASGIWATCGIGMAIGAGMYIVGLSTTAIVLFIQYVLHQKTRFMTQHKIRSLSVYGVNKEHYQDYITDELIKKGITINEVSVNRTTDLSYDYTFVLDMPQDIKEESIVSQITYQCKIDFIH